jgi:hypothetical protein
MLKIITPLNTFSDVFELISSINMILKQDRQEIKNA